MITTGILLNIAGLGVVCWALFTLAVYALPFFVGMTAGMYTYRTGIGPIGAIAVGFVAGAFGLLAGRYLFSVTRSPTIRLVIALLFAAPAAWAGYEVTLSLAHIGISSEWWREVFALVGAVGIGCTAWARVAILTTPVLSEGVGAGSAPSPLGPCLGSVTTDGGSFGSVFSRLAMEREAVVLRDREITALAGALRTGGDDPVGRR